jgi:serine phosphatase RsbU (regulator of sigma subunit)/tetratricopeptide (TPR) repeat protein
MKVINRLIFLILIQSTFYNAQIDSLYIESIVNNSKLKDPKLSRYFKISDSLFLVSKKQQKAFIEQVNRRAKIKGNKFVEAHSSNTLGLWYEFLGLYSDAYNWFNQALKISEETNDYSIKFNALSNLGTLYYYMNNFEKSLDYQNKALKLIKDKLNSSKNYSRITSVYINMGGVYGRMNKLDLARNYFLRAFDYYKQDPEKDSITKAYIYNNIASTYINAGDLKTSENYLLTAYNLKINYGGDDEKASAYKNYGDFLKSKKQPEEAKKMFAKSITFYGNSLSEDVRACFESMAQINMELKNYKEAYEYLKLVNKTNNYLDSIGQVNEIGNNEIRMELRQKSVKDSVQNQIQLNLKEEKLVQKKRESYFGVFILIIVSAFAFLFYRRFKLTQKQKVEIEFQKKVVDVKNREITESINYAKNVQDALMPNVNDLSKLFKESFITYLPKDIVAGDFYWWHDFADTGKKKVLIAAADSTGHGVPGAMVSVVCINALNRAVNEFGRIKPNEVLDRVNIIVNETFSKNNKQINDGMDISLLLVDYDEGMVYWSGANNRLIYFVNEQLIELKPDKQAIGKSEIKKPFHLHFMPLVKGNVYYLFTDGFSDQFGGSKNKKMGFAQLRNLMLQNYNKPMLEQGKYFEAIFIDWKNNLEQTDDVTLLGIKV